MMPKRVKRRKEIVKQSEPVENQTEADKEDADPEEEEAGWEEYYDYVFPDEQSTQKSSKILEIAHKWKQAQAAANEE
jgi:crooked neck